MSGDVESVLSEYEDVRKRNLGRRLAFHIGYMLMFMGCYIKSYEYFGRFDQIEHLLPSLYVMKTYYWGYATVWTMFMKWVFLCLAIWYDLLEWRGQEYTSFAKQLNYYKEMIFSTVFVPFICYASVVFWVCYWIDRELVYPEVFDQILDPMFNHVLHTSALLLVIAHQILEPRTRAIDRNTELTIVIAVYVFYAIVYHTLCMIIDNWLYKFYTILTLQQRVVFQTFSVVLLVIFYYGHYATARFVSPKNERKIQ